MARDDLRETPHTRTGAPGRPPDATRDAAGEAGEGRAPARRAGDDTGSRGDRMPAGADEPGAGP
jgi:hypothetical protein